MSKLAAFAAIHPGCGVERVKDEQAVDADAHEPFVAPGSGGLRRKST
nr:hypothetical protein [Paraburkholderia sp. BL8N3]